MISYVANEITIKEPSPAVIKWCKLNLVFPNPEYSKKGRMGLWIGNIPKLIIMFKKVGNSLVIPYGALADIYPLLKEGEIVSKFEKPVKIDYEAQIPLRDYQTLAVNTMVECRGGILQAPAGSGKTQCGIAIITSLQKRALWITHTKDLLNQSKTRAEQFIDSSLIGTITEGKVHMGTGITFATVQTLCNINLNLYRNYWDVIIVDEAHRVATSMSSLTQFSKVLETLSARYKYGLSATVHRADGLINTTFSLIGNLMYTVPDEAVNDYILKVKIHPKNTRFKGTKAHLNTDGTINHIKLINALCLSLERNTLICEDLITNSLQNCLILSDRVEHLKTLMSMLPKDIQSKCVQIDGSTKKHIRELAIEDMRSGKKRLLFASYRLAKEGLDIPILDRLFLVTPHKDYAVITQSIGRIARQFEGKEEAICYDYIDDIPYLIKSFKKRLTVYRKNNCLFL